MSSLDLPPELERLIFETAADDHENLKEPTLYLMLVARRVYKWIRPIRYRVVKGIQHPGKPDFTFTPLVQDFKEIGPFIQHLVLSGHNAEPLKNLMTCPNIQNLALWTDPLLHVLLRRYFLHHYLPLRRLATHASYLDSGIYKGPSFSNVSHLRLYQRAPLTLDYLSALVYLPKLTHLWLDNTYPQIRVLRIPLMQCPLLRILLVLKTSWTFDPGLTGVDAREHRRQECLTVEDPRLVLIDDVDNVNRVNGWVDSIRGFFDLWCFAEQFRDARSRRLFIDSSQQFISPDDFKWAEELNGDGQDWYKAQEIKPLELWELLP